MAAHGKYPHHVREKKRVPPLTTGDAPFDIENDAWKWYGDPRGLLFGKPLVLDAPDHAKLPDGLLVGAVAYYSWLAAVFALAARLPRE